MIRTNLPDVMSCVKSDNRTLSGTNSKSMRYAIFVGSFLLLKRTECTPSSPSLQFRPRFALEKIVLLLFQSPTYFIDLRHSCDCQRIRGDVGSNSGACSYK